MIFPCIQCGLCCRRLDRTVDTIAPENINGICIYLEGSLCKIYEKRPLCCNIEVAYKLLFKDVLTQKEFYLQNLEICFALNQEAGLYTNCNRLTRIINKLYAS